MAQHPEQLVRGKKRHSPGPSTLSHCATAERSTFTGSGGYTHRFFKAARSREEVIKQRDAIAA
jgi:hypothetical protein